MAHDLLVSLFVTAAGMTASGIVANLYRLLVGKTASAGGRVLYLVVMVIAGPNVLLESAARARRKKKCSRAAFWLAAALSGYWSLAIGLFVVGLSLAL